MALGALFLPFIAVLCTIFFSRSIVATASAGEPLAQRTFTIKDNLFIKDGLGPYRIISGSIHYQRIHPAYWLDRLLRIRSMGMNSIQVYVPWNWHEPQPGKFDFSGDRDVEHFLRLAGSLGLHVLLRPGPYICSEWDYGGLPWWLSSSKVPGGRTMRLRSNDTDYLGAVQRWWGELLPRVRPLLYHNGGPIIMVQVENEIGYFGQQAGKQAVHAYLRQLIAIARTLLGPEVLLYTTDPPALAEWGSLPGAEIYSAVDFWQSSEEGVAWAYWNQRNVNAPGQSPPFCSEFYVGNIAHWGEVQPVTQPELIAVMVGILLQFANGSGSVNFYMAHGGTSFGFWAGANLWAPKYSPHETSYDFEAPISEAGDYGQPGIPPKHQLSKFNLMRDAIAAATGVTPPEPLPRPPIAEYGRVELSSGCGSSTCSSSANGSIGGGVDGPLLLLDDALLLHCGALSRPVHSEWPLTLEEAGQRNGVAVYRTYISMPPPGGPPPAGVLYLRGVHDYASVYLEGRLVGRVSRSQGDDAVVSLPLPPPPVFGPGGASDSGGGSSHDGAFAEGEAAGGGGDEEGGQAQRATTNPEGGGGGGLQHRQQQQGQEWQQLQHGQQQGQQLLRLDLVVEAQGHNSFFLHDHDPKGLTMDVLLDGRPLRNWTLFSLSLDSLPELPWPAGTVGGAEEESRPGQHFLDPGERLLDPAAASQTRRKLLLNGEEEEAQQQLQQEQGKQEQVWQREPMQGQGRQQDGRQEPQQGQEGRQQQGQGQQGQGQERQQQQGQERQQQQGQQRQGQQQQGQPMDRGPAFFRGRFQVPDNARGLYGHPADTYLSLRGGWVKGVAYVNGINLGWYWPGVGPQMTLYVPGPLLRPGREGNQLVLLELRGAPAHDAAVELVSKPDFFGVGPEPEVGPMLMRRWRKKAGSQILTPASARLTRATPNSLVACRGRHAYCQQTKVDNRYERDGTSLLP